MVLFSYLTYAAAFIPREGEEGPIINPGLVAMALVLAPLVFIVVGFVSRNPLAPKRVLTAMGLLVGIGLALGLVAPVFGAAAGFGVGVAWTLNMPDIPGQMKRRLAGIGFALGYMFLLLIVATPAGVLTGAVLPSLMVGFADEYGAWQLRRQQGP